MTKEDGGGSSYTYEEGEVNTTFLNCHVIYLQSLFLTKSLILINYIYEINRYFICG